MKLNPNFKVNEIADEFVLVNTQSKQRNFTHLLVLNATSKLLFECLTGKDFSLNDAAQVLVDHYGIDSEKAMKGAESWVKAMKEYRVLA